MRTKLIILCALPLVFGLRAWGQYSIDWSTIDGGGGTSTGGVYTISGTIGQPDANQQTMNGGNYSLVVGFWSLFAIQTPGAPLLTITRTATNTMIVSWPLPADGWVLERTNALSTAAANWPQVTPPYMTNATTISVTFTNTTPPGNQFYRLHKP